jgi:hypothetical protein
MTEESAETHVVIKASGGQRGYAPLESSLFYNVTPSIKLLKVPRVHFLRTSAWLALFFLAAMSALAAQATAAQLDRRPAVQTVFTGEASCPLAPRDTKESALKRCFTAARVNLLDNAAKTLEKSFKPQAPDMNQADYRAVAAGLLTPEIDGRDFVETGETAVVTIKLKAALDPDKLAAKIKEAAASPELRGKLAAAQKAADAEDKKILDSAPSGAAGDASAYADFSKAAEERRKIMGKMHATADSASANIRRGMSNDQVRSLLGEPGSIVLGTVIGNFICLGYGEVWVVLENGLASCMRERLEYSKTYESECHCAGLRSGFVPFATDSQTGPTPRKGTPNAGQTGQNP